MRISRKGRTSELALSVGGYIAIRAEFLYRLPLPRILTLSPILQAVTEKIFDITGEACGSSAA